jgi:SET domain-containing protein
LNAVARQSGKTFRVGRAQTGLGLFAIRDIGKGERIVEYRGRRIPTRLAQELDRRRANKYLFEIDARWTIDGKARTNVARYVNHACRPNAEAELVRGRMLFVARKRIRPGDEITIDYGEEHMQLYFRDGCRCAVCSHEPVLPAKRAKQARAATRTPQPT